MPVLAPTPPNGYPAEPVIDDNVLKLVEDGWDALFAAHEALQTTCRRIVDELDREDD